MSDFALQMLSSMYTPLRTNRTDGSDKAAEMKVTRALSTSNDVAVHVFDHRTIPPSVLEKPKPASNCSRAGRWQQPQPGIK